MATAGQFVRIARDAAGARVAALVGTTEAFTIDDFTYAATPLPEAGSSLGLLLAGALLGLFGRRGPASEPGRRTPAGFAAPGGVENAPGSDVDLTSPRTRE